MRKIYILLVTVFIGLVGEAQIVTIPDANFKARLLAASPSNTIASDFNGYIKIDANNDGEIQVSEAQAVYHLDVSNSNIGDLTGIASFTSIGELYCNNNHLTTLDLSNNLGENPDIPGQSQFSGIIDARNNQLTWVSFPSLYYFNIDELYLSSNMLTTIQLPTSEIDYFECDNNPNLTSILAKTTAFAFFDYGLDYTLTMANCANLSLFCVYNGYLTQAQALVDGYGYTNCNVTSSCQLGAEEFTNNNVVLYPNPVKNVVTITMGNNEKITASSIYNTLGQLVQVNTNPNETIDVSGLQSGSYFVRISSDKGSASGKFIKE